MFGLLYLVCGLKSQSTALVMLRRSLTTLSLGKLRLTINQYSVHILSLVTDNNPS